VHEWTTANGLKLNLIKSQVIVISCCRVDIPPPTLLIESDVIKVVPKVNNIGFVLNVRITATDHFKKVRRRLVVSLIMPHIGYGGIVYAVADAAMQRRFNVAFRTCLRYIYSLRRLIMYPTGRQVLWALRWLIMLGFSFCRFFTKSCMFGIRIIYFSYFVLLPPPYEEFGGLGSSLSCDESVLCCIWLPGVECAASWHEDFAYAGSICFRCEEDGPWRGCFELSYLFVFTHVFCFCGFLI
jgi:hypothetical protein